ncbi:MAG: hypothetical protein JOZ18_06245 [Chloroflexi bacterium]|nr:hypothetical protein [Chloroflexota bacterium]
MRRIQTVLAAIEVAIGLAGLVVVFVAAWLVVTHTDWVQRYAPFITDNFTVIMQASAGVFGALLGTYCNDLFIKGHSPLSGNREDFLKICGISQLLTVALSVLIQPRANELTSALVSGASAGAVSVALIRGAQIWGGALLAYVRNLIQTWIFSWAIKPTEPQEVSSAAATATQTTPSVAVKWFWGGINVFLVCLGVIGSLIGLIGYPILAANGVLRAILQEPDTLGAFAWTGILLRQYLLEVIQGLSGAGQAWSGTFFNFWLRERKLPGSSREFMKSCALAMSITVLSSVALQYLSDQLTQGATAPLVAQGIASMASAVIGVIRGGIVAPLAYGLVGGNVRQGFGAMFADIKRLLRRH